MKEILTFLRALRKNNNKEWFDAHRKKYEEVRGQFIDTLQQLILEVAKFEPGIGNLRPKDCMFRINRDIRFSNDKRPYKDNFGAVISRGGKKSPFGVYYFHIQPGNESIVAGGIYMPQPDVLKKIRQEIDYNPKPLLTYMKSRAFRQYFGELSEDKLKRTPQGYSEDHPNAELLKYKSYIVVRGYTDREVQDKNFLKEVVKSFRAMKPLNDYLNTALDG
jgi:uncharacterized protein (TIGR02453 family)